MGGFALGVSSDVTLDLDYNDTEVLKEHPIVGQFMGLAFNDVLGIVGVDRETVEGYSVNWTDAHEAISNDKDHDYYNRVMEGKAAVAVLKIVEALDSGSSAAKLEFVHENLFTGSASVKSPGIGKAGSLAAKFFFMQERVNDALDLVTS